MDFITDLENRLRQEIPSSPVPARSSSVAQTTSKQPNNLVLFGVIFGLVLLVFVVYKYRTGGLTALVGPQQPPQQQSQPYFSYPQVQPWSNLPIQQPQQQWTLPPSNNPEIEMLKRQYETLDAAARKIWERTKWTNDRITLLATINNHNLVVQQNNLPKTELIFLNADWTINRMPDRIQLDASDQEFMRQFIKK
jgi:hypothetical protein